MDRAKLLKEMMERRKAAGAAAAGAAAASPETTQTSVSSGDGAERMGRVPGSQSSETPPTKGIGRGELLAKLRKKKEEEAAAAGVGGVSAVGDAPAATDQGSRHQRILSKLKAKKEASASEVPTAPNSGGGASCVSDGKSNEMEKLNKAFNEAKLEPAVAPPRSRGEKGTKFQASANYVRLKVKKEMGVFDHHVTFTPPVDGIKQRKSIIREIAPQIGEVRCFDGATLSLPHLLDFPMMEFKVNTGGVETVVKLKFVKKKMNTDAIHLYNKLFNRIFEELKLIEIKRKFYNPEARMMVPSQKLEIWPGYVNRVQETDGGLMLLCDTSSKVLRQETAYTLMQDVKKKKGANFQQSLEKALLGAVVMTEYNRAATYRIDDIDHKSSPKSTFKLYTGDEISYMEYYKKFYSITIKDPNQPMLIHRTKKKMVDGKEEERIISLVPELCRMTGMTDEMRSDFRVMKDVANATRITPDKRQQCLRKFLENVRDNKDCQAILSDWGLELDTEPVRLEARTLAPEKLQLGKGKEFQVNQKVDWGRETTSNHCLVPKNINKWHVVYTERNKSVVAGMIDLFKKQGPRMGIQVSQPTQTCLANDRTESYCSDIRSQVEKQTGLQLIVAVMPMEREDRYGAVKRLCNTDLPIPSQVVNAKTISNEKRVMSVVQKIILQVNCKLGGELWGSNIPIPQLMCVGVDVYHDKNQKKESVVAMVASMNSTMSAYASACGFQRPGQEIIDVMKVLLGKLVAKYKEANGVAPTKILLYRDGVGDGDIGSNVLHEVDCIESLLEQTNVQAKFSFIVVQKRINMRFFNLVGNQYTNPLPGSLLDHTIMKKGFLDFILVSQFASETVVCPTHYIIVKDNTGLSLDHIQRISYKLTHQYFNWSGTVKIPAPVQYAHKLAYQVGENTNTIPDPQLMNKLFFL
eukprot:TRINITY_DN2571_c0_g1_i14.p1 TRINITY_DN2571_c0_g1~~TRINITY_DN2571_c0_g1_i14.p1  ORF type:complete len:919 (-),score=292.46 TRINITY_DN2571_c0_g1_i14:527-3283(-)